MTYASIHQRHPRVTGEQIEKGPEGEIRERRSISHFRQLGIQPPPEIGYIKAK